jgi:hypothetical protein
LISSQQIFAKLIQEREKRTKNLKKVAENFVRIKKGSIFANAKGGTKR